MAQTAAGEELRALLAGVRRRWQAARALRATARAAASAAAAVLAVVAVERLVQPPDALLLALASAALLLGLAAAVRALGRRRGAPGDRQVARYIEERCPALQDRLASASEIAIGGGASSPLGALLVADAARHARAAAVDARRVVPRRELGRRLAQALAAAAGLLLVLAAGSDALGRLARTAWLIAQPHAAAPDAGSDEPREPPRVERIDVAYRYPSWLGLPPRKEIDGGDVQAPPGTEVTLTVHLSRPVEQAVLELAAGGPTALAAAGDPARLAGAFEVRSDDTYRIRARAADGLQSPAGDDYFIRAVPDEPPVVEVLRPAGDREITPLEEVVVEARAEDDYGLHGFELVYGPPGGAGRVVALQDEAGAARSLGAHTIYAEDLALQPGDFMTWHVRARDAAGAETRSDIYFLEVRPFGREFEEARSQDAAGMPSGELGRLAEQQKQIVVAAWKLDGRRPAGRDPQDLETVADAQNDVALAARVLASRLRTPAPAVDVGGGSDESRAAQAALAGAIEWMAEAERALRAGQTEAAIPPAMAALDGLRRAQDQSRRTEVPPPGSRPQAGNGNAPQEDLSALFDRELRRDQETNYENRPRPPESDAAAGDDAEALRQRLAELARRQEDLQRRQQALDDAAQADGAARADGTPGDGAQASGQRADGEQGGGSQPADERRLDRLAREQAELRREQEALRQDMAALGRELLRRLAERAAPGAGAATEGREDALEALTRARPDLRPDLERWARHWWSGPAPGAAAGLDDRSAWTSLYSDLQVLLAELEISRARALAGRRAGERPGLGAEHAAPPPYRRLVDEYFRALAEPPPAR